MNLKLRYRCLLISIISLITLKDIPKDYEINPVNVSTVFQALYLSESNEGPTVYEIPLTVKKYVLLLRSPFSASLNNYNRAVINLVTAGHYKNRSGGIYNMARIDPAFFSMVSYNSHKGGYVTNLSTGPKRCAAFVTFGVIGNSFITNPSVHEDHKFYGVGIHPLTVEFNLPISNTALVFQSAALTISNFGGLVNIWTGTATLKAHGGWKGKPVGILVCFSDVHDCWLKQITRIRPHVEQVPCESSG